MSTSAFLLSSNTSTTTISPFLLSLLLPESITSKQQSQQTRERERVLETIEMRIASTIQTTSTMTVAAATTTSKATFSPTATIQHSPWNSSVPYLFGGIAAMLGVIAFALLILACSFWKLSGHVSNGENGDRDVEANEDKPETTVKAVPVVEERIVVIMAGDLKPTFLATPMCSRASSFEDGDGKREKMTKKPESADQKPKEEMGSHELATTIENRETNETETSQEQNQ